MSSKPKTVAINHDDYEARYVGRTVDGLQFFLTTPFVPASGRESGREFIALYLFDAAGKLRTAEIDDLGPRSTLNEDKARAMVKQRLGSLGKVKFGNIVVQPFKLRRFGATFGFVPRAPEEKGEAWWVIVEPGDYMAFTEPFDSGEYDT